MTFSPGPGWAGVQFISACKLVVAMDPLVNIFFSLSSTPVVHHQQRPDNKNKLGSGGVPCLHTRQSARFVLGF